MDNQQSTTALAVRLATPEDIPLIENFVVELGLGGPSYKKQSESVRDFLISSMGGKPLIPMFL